MMPDRTCDRPEPPLRVTIAGCGDAFGSGGRLNACFYVDTGAYRLLIDCGATVLPALKANHIDPASVDMILISHLHGDHYGGLPYFLLEASLYRGGKPLTILGPPGCKDCVSSLLHLLYPGSPVLDRVNIRFLDYAPGLDPDGLQVEAYEMIHSEGLVAYGLRINLAGKVISYSGDTEWTEALVALSRNADLFICECSFYHSRVKGHINYETLAANLGRLTCKRILLTHLDSEMLHKRGQVKPECAYDGMRLQL